MASILPAAYYLPQKIKLQDDPESQQNFIILVCDAWSASNTSLYGYPRQTTPFLEKLADKAIVYHNHYAGGHWTYPGTASLLTGTLPWTHRGYSQSLSIAEPYHTKNLFGLFETHHRSAYTHNAVADPLLRQMMSVLSTYKPRQELFVNKDFWLSNLFGNDYDTASTAWVRIAKKFDDGYANSLFLSRLYNIYNKRAQREIFKEYPMGLPSVEEDNYFRLETAIDWVLEQANAQPEPFLGYYHMLPPHAPYNTRRDFSGTFRKDNFEPTVKPIHPINSDVAQDRLNFRRTEYDEFILLVDSEINRLYNLLAKNNILENTWLIVTSDHGEMFERGIIGHLEPTFHHPLMHVPLLIFPPGQQERVDVYSPTSAIDLLPTLLHIAGKPIPESLEGELLPPYNPAPNPDRQIFGMDARFSGTNEGPFKSATVMLRQGAHKLAYFFGDQKKYEALNGEPYYELYNLEEDPEELNNLFDKQPELAEEMLNAILAAMENHGVRET